MIPGLGVTLLGTIGLMLWARWLGRIEGVPRFVRYLAWIFFAFWSASAVNTVLGMIATFGALSGESIDPSQKARVLAEGISEGMNVFALFVCTQLLSALVMLALTWKYRWSAKRP